MTNFFYGGNLRENERFVSRRNYHSYGRDYENAGNSDCDFCHDVYDRTELLYVLPEDDNNEDPEKIAWTVKLCCPCLNVITHDHEVQNLHRRGIYAREDW